MLAGRRILPDGTILDADGNVIGHFTGDLNDLDKMNLAELDNQLADPK